LKASVSKANPQEVSGWGSFDGVDLKMLTLGSKSNAEGPAANAPRLTAIPASAQGDARLVLLGATNGSAMDLEVSEDMVQWRRIGTMLGNGESQLQVDTDSRASTQRFYRVIPRKR
jgi:negative regulator of sigma E activity